MVVSEHWMDGANRIIGLPPLLCGMLLLLGVAILGFVIVAGKKKK